MLMRTDFTTQRKCCKSSTVVKTVLLLLKTDNLLFGVGIVNGTVKKVFVSIQTVMQEILDLLIGFAPMGKGGEV